MTADMPAGQEVSLVFPVPLMVRDIPDAEATNAGLRRLILAREQASGGVSVSNKGGWHSDATLLTWPEPEVATLKGWIDAAVQRICRVPLRDGAAPLTLAYRAHAWANVNRYGNYNSLHSHAGSHWSVVYYVAIGEEAPGDPNTGAIELRDPRPAAVHGRLPGFMFGRSLTIHPRPGLIVVFPAWIEHCVHPFFGKGERISIAVNVDVTKYDAGPGVVP